MAWFKIYAGLGGGFGGPNYIGTFEFDSEDDALQTAYDMSVEEYQSYEGAHGIMSWDDCRDNLFESHFDYDDESVDAHYQEEIESWISYRVEPTQDQFDTDDE